MKWLLVILVVFISLAFTYSDKGYATKSLLRDTVPTGAAPQLFGGKLYEFKNYQLVDSFLMIMGGDTFAIPRWPAIKYKNSDNRWYGYHGTRWRAFLNGTDTISLSNRINSVSFTLSNVGSGHRLVTTPFGSIKTLASSNTILWDSTSNANALTAKADTAVLATQYDLTQIVSGINELTGDVTAGPGTGSQAATIAANAVSNAKFRQSAGLSVVGRSTNSTGNVADITAAIASTYLKRSTTQILWDSIDFAEIKNTPALQNPGVYFGPATSFDPTFVVFASAIVYPNNSWSNGVPINWQILDYTTAHNSSFFDSAGYNSGSQRLKVFFPTVKNVINTTITPDETISSRCIVTGSTTALDNFEAPLYSMSSLGARLTGNGTTTWTKNSGTCPSCFSVDSYNTGNGLTRFDVLTAAGAFNYDPDGIGLQYIGTSGYTIRRQYSALGAYTVGFILQDAFGNAVTAAPTSNDEILISNSGNYGKQINAYAFDASNTWFTTSCNFWTFGVYECWLVAAPTSTTSTLVRWQITYPSATNYKIYRSTTKHGARTLIHTGTEGSYVDSGLSSATLYYYHLVAVIGGVDTYITYFTTNTK